VPDEGRAKIQSALKQAGANFHISFYEAEHAFMRDEGPRYDSEATDQAFGEMVNFFRRTL
jgi:carboxymethylenebutenolidase